MTILSHALAAAERGWKVFPVLPNSKTPAISGWPSVATNDTNIINKWWQSEPNYNYGIVSGVSGLIIVDVDRKPGAFEEFERLHKEVARWLDTYKVTTPSGGIHLYYKVGPDHGLGDMMGQVANGIDIRVYGYCVGPGSVINGKEYKHQSGSPVYVNPTFLAHLQKIKAEQALKRNKPVTPPPAPEDIDYAATLKNAHRYMEKPEGIPEGSRNAQAYFLASRMVRGFALAEPDAWKLLAEWNDRNQPPLDHDELRRTLDSAQRTASETIGAYAQRKQIAPEDILRRKPEPVAPPDPVVEWQPEEAPNPIELPEESAPQPNHDDCPWISQQLTVADFRKYIDDRKFIVPEYIPERSVTVVYGAPGSHKSNWLMDLAVRAATGEYGAPVPTGWIDVDNGMDTMKERVEAFVEAIAPGSDLSPRVICFPDPAPLFAREDVQLILQRWVEIEGLKLIIIDNLLRISGGLDENSTEMDVPLRVMRAISNSTGCAFIVIHHKRKSEGSRGEDMRGSTAIEAAVDSTFRVTRKNNDNVITVQNVKARRCPAKTRRFRFSYSHKPATPYVLQSAYFTEEESDEDGGQDEKHKAPAKLKPPKVEPPPGIEGKFATLWKTLYENQFAVAAQGLPEDQSWLPKRELTKKLGIRDEELDSPPYSDCIETREGRNPSTGRAMKLIRLKE